MHTKELKAPVIKVNDILKVDDKDELDDTTEKLNKAEIRQIV